MQSILDHGYLDVISVEGTDRFIAETARTSTESTGNEDANNRLVTRLIRDEHTSPVEFAGFVFQIKAPIFVGRQWLRHRAGTFNEFSGRYSEFPDEFYVPDADRVQVQSTFNKQGSAESLPEDVADLIRHQITKQSLDAYQSYQSLLATGLTRELARIILPVNFYTVYRWRVNLHNLFHFLRLRQDPHAQWEIRVYADAIHEECLKHFPVATKAFEEHIQNRIVISPSLARDLAAGDITEGNSEMQDFLRKYGVV